MTTTRLRRHKQRLIILIPWLYVLAAILLGYAVPKMNAHFLPWLVSPLDRDVIIACLSAASTGMMALTGIVFALGTVMITFATSAFTPRLVSAFADRTLVHALGVFTGSFLYMLIVLRAVGKHHAEPVSEIPLLISIIWIIASVYMLFRMIIRTWTMNEAIILTTLGTVGLQTIRRTYPTPYTSISAAKEGATAFALEENVIQSVVYHGRPLYISRYDVTSLVFMAQAADAVVQLPYAIGDAIIEGDTLAVVYGQHPFSEERLREAMELDQDRSLESDPMYAMRLLTDIAIHALSPAINDPTTAVEALNKTEALLRTLGVADLQIGRVEDIAGVVRLVYPTPTWEEYLHLGIIEILHYGADSVQVQRRIGMLLHSLHDVVPEARRTAVEQLAVERVAIVHRAFPDTYESVIAEADDRQGLGRTWVA
ncbi:MAG TPA: DUF2254 family protein [Armatimonadota bacterium]|nr:DUF2254 family protein [Armatimonadota bacterium]